MPNPLVDSWGEFLGGFRWGWYVTLTFDGDLKTFTAHNRCAAWLRSLEKAAGQPIAWFRGDEYGERFGKFHMHLLIANVEHLHRFTWMERWAVRNGYARIYEFDPRMGAAWYVSKYVTKQLGEWDLSENIEAFRIQQPILPLIGQRGSPHLGDMAPSIKAISRKRRSLRKKQLPLSDFKESDSSDLDNDEIRASFRDQTKRKG